MNLHGIVAVSGKPGLWKALAQNKTGYVLESLDEKKTKLIANVATAKLAALSEITIFGLEDDIKLTDLFEKMKSVNVPAANDDGKKLRAFFFEIAPDHDEEKVYSSDIKKIINWYQLLKDLPLFNEADPAEAPAAEEEAPAPAAPVAEPVAEVKEEAAPKAKAKKAPAKKA